MAKRLAIAPSTFSYDLCSDYASRPAVIAPRSGI